MANTPPKVSLRKVRHAAQTHEDALQALKPILVQLTNRVIDAEAAIETLTALEGARQATTDTCWKRLRWLCRGVA